MKLQGNYLVLGLGESGLAMARWLVRCGARVRVADSRATPPGVDALRCDCPQAEILCAPFVESLLEGIDCLALSPGLSVNEPLVLAARARGITITGEIELFIAALAALGERQRCKLIAITGTNGKTTTTTLVGELARAAGRETAVAGNISPAALDELMRRLDAGKLPEVWVLELSSFQLETTAALNADAAAVLNVTDDHLDRHGAMAAYAASKAGVFNGHAVQVVNREDHWASRMLRDGHRQISFGLGQPPAGEDFGVIKHAGERWLARGQEPLMPAADVPLAGDHNLANVLAALALCVAIDLPLAPLLLTVQSFKGLSHRVERVAGREDGVVFYDDSKGTNVGATLAALQGLGRKVVLIAGGDGKGQDFSPLTEALRQHARAVVLIGRDATRLEEETRASGADYVHAASMEEAVRVANAKAAAGDAVLLSPACASLDMFRNYAHRAEVFITATLALPGVKP
ncbi:MULTISPECIES: UDP-N-acetylmuramoyl-L-alanine--D-glutamate ligase [unclassified Uliginosibacterium]|uniref:UDP-N-acetylmuramoyl-L-alanine--D-glutamate ligase n=1 Tax=unclassified Uliginosibacterium TaxID=2621521 RepID=UPI000C7CBF7D|nr:MULTISPECIES: UDP-N-acetylmuramoyl-L-alanine--D-glutamate ligase [unclassified Uliginosibacterium]MDO6387377.1 UDP-N-acetylmuramoyl-L-alanine--D-glutamate ligase [Uliginosibacterium sp. 31-12]PLK47176.1 UDP-N-acetylmuramoyl-L-alanine--D-glutamate ligase [Uliginosibacterium sp. TH139]